MISTIGSDSPHGAYPAPRAGIVLAGKAPRFSAETLALLRSRMTAAALLASAALACAFVFDLFVRGVMLVPLHVGLLLAFAGGYAILRSRLPLTGRQLRSIEILLFAAFNVQLLALLTVAVVKHVQMGEPVLAVSERDFYTANFSLGIVTYGLFIPNHWKRALAVIFPFAIVAYLYPMALAGGSAKVAAAFKLSPINMLFPSALLSSLIAVAGAHVMYSVRRKAFEARRFGQYVLGERIGKGGMGEVHRAEHVLLKRACAIKLIRADTSINEQSLARFEREVKATAHLSHWNTVEVFDYGRTDDGTFYYVMELLKGMNLDQLVRRNGPLPPQRVVYLLRQACHALREAHAAGLVHRDVKPANLFCAELGGVFDVVKLLDFGLVRDREAVDVVRPPQGTVVGSPYYMAPEQNTDPKSTDPRSDIYALGCVGFYLLTGKPPFDKPTKLTTLYAHAFEEAIPPSQIADAVPKDLEQIIMRCLSKDPAARFQSAQELELALRNCECADQWNEEKASNWWLQMNQEAAPGVESSPVKSGR